MSLTKLKLCVALLVALQMLPQSALSERRSPGRYYNAQIETDDGTYHVPVQVRDGEVTSVRLPRGKKMSLRGADLNEGEATGSDFYGDRVKVKIEDSSYDQEGVEGKNEYHWSDR